MKKSFFGLIILFIFLTTYTPKFDFIIGSDFSIQKIEIEGNSILNSDEIGVIKAGEQGSSGDLSKFSGKGSVSIRRDGNHQLNPLDEINEDYLYHGKENPIIMTNSIVVRLGCKFHLKM